MKRRFKFYLPDGTVETNTDTTHLKSLGMTDEFIERRQLQEEAHFVSEMYNERKWRNQQLKDALYLKQLGVVSDHILDEYVAALKAYDLKYQPRPGMPAQQSELQRAWDEWLV